MLPELCYAYIPFNSSPLDLIRKVVVIIENILMT